MCQKICYFQWNILFWINANLYLWSIFFLQIFDTCDRYYRVFFFFSCIFNLVYHCNLQEIDFFESRKNIIAPTFRSWKGSFSKHCPMFLWVVDALNKYKSSSFPHYSNSWQKRENNQQTLVNSWEGSSGGVTNTLS